MRGIVYGFFGYAPLNFAIFMITAPKGATHADDRDKGRRCGNGHAVGPLALFCEQCGQPVIEP
jgi:hypothetical protein